MKFLFLDRYGIWFDYKGDQVCYTFPWRKNRLKKFNDRFYSISFSCYFKSLKALDNMWTEYWKAFSNEKNEGMVG